MNHSKKQSVIDSLKSDFSNNHGSFLVEIKGMSVSELQALRKNVKKYGGAMKVAKNTLLSLASLEYPYLEQLRPYFKNQIAIIFSKEVSPEIASTLCKTSEENEKFKILAGCLDNNIVTRDKIKFLSSIGSREVVLARLAGLLKSPMIKIAWVLQEVSKNK